MLIFPFSKPGVISLLPLLISFQQNEDDSANTVLAGMPSLCPAHSPDPRREIMTVCCLGFFNASRITAPLPWQRWLSQMKKQFSRNQIYKKWDQQFPSLCATSQECQRWVCTRRMWCPERLLWNALTKACFANYPDPLKLKADDLAFWWYCSAKDLVWLLFPPLCPFQE